MISEHDLVILNGDLPAENLKAGEVGTAIRLHASQDTVDVEFFSPDGESSRVVNVPAERLELHGKQTSAAGNRSPAGSATSPTVIEANGITVHYQLTGPEEAPVVMLCHSLAANFAMWDAQLGALAARYQVLRYDLRGHGATAATSGPYSLELLADDALALMDALGIHACHFIGLSIGGMIGQVLALRKAKPILSLALCATSSRIPPEAQPAWEERIRTAESDGMSALAQATLDRWLSQDFQRREPAETKRIRKMIESTPLAGYVGCAHAIRSLNLTERLKQIDLPTLIIVGKDDPGTPVAASEVIQREIKGSRLLVLDDAMHLCNIEQAEAFDAALREFVDKLEPGYFYAGH
jgi:3-oxoadipate enol-lactonase